MLAATEKLERTIRASIHGPFYELILGILGRQVLYHTRDKVNQVKFGPTWSKKACLAYIAIMESVT